MFAVLPGWAITSETFRASLRSVGREQMDACVALGLPRAAQIVNVILPQAVLRAVPTLLSNAVSLFKESALVSAVGMADLMFIGQNISNNTARPVEVLTVVAAIYFVIAFPLTRAVTVVEQKLLRKFSA
ncbi:ABC transporter permease subunit [Paracoccus pantotrophus]|nr:ABC transporter permease subunit [Paracoccus pantotrophus]